jgi:hypothetical protein
MKYDVVIGNPPYQGPNSKLGQKQLYHRFIELAIQQVKDSGWIAYVTPPNFLQYKRRLIDGCSITSIQLTEAFKVGACVSWYTLKKEEGQSVIPLTNYIPIYDLTPMAFSITNKVMKADGIKGIWTRNNGGIVEPEWAHMYRVNRAKTFNVKLYKDLEKTTRYEFYTDFNPQWVMDVYNSELFDYIYYTNMNTPFLYESFINNITIPKERIPIEELYQYYNLTQEEIEYVRSLQETR